MKKILLGVIFSVLILTAVAVPVRAEYKIQILVDDQFMYTKDEPSKPFVDENNRTQVPIRFVSEKLGAKVFWEKDGVPQTVTIERNGYTAVLTIGKKTAMLNGNPYELDTTAFIKGERTFVPLRFISEALGVKVYWDAKMQQVLIRTFENSETVNGFTIPKPRKIGVSTNGISKHISMTLYVNDDSKNRDVQIDEVKFIFKDIFTQAFINEAIIGLKQQMENNVSSGEKVFTDEHSNTVTVSSSNALTVDLKVDMQ